MGAYIEVDVPTGKAQQIQEKFDAQIVVRPLHFETIPEDRALICVVQNSTFDAAAFIYDEREFREFTRPPHEDPRPRTWLLMSYKKAVELTRR